MGQRGPISQPCWAFTLVLNSLIGPTREHPTCRAVEPSWHRVPEQRQCPLLIAISVDVSAEFRARHCPQDAFLTKRSFYSSVAPSLDLTFFTFDVRKRIEDLFLTAKTFLYFTSTSTSTLQLYALLGA